MQKRYNNDPVKARSRDLVRSLLERTLLKEKPASEVNVICLPGIDAQEVLEVYDPLGIPRQNITGLEIDPEIAAEIERKNLGIKVRSQSAESYFDTIGQHDYDVVSLDFTGTANESTLRLLRNISQKQRKSSFALHTAHSMRRDAELLYFLRRVNTFEKFMVGMSDIASAALHVTDSEETKGLRDVHYTQFIMDGLAVPDLLGYNAGNFLFGKELYSKIVDRTFSKCGLEASKSEEKTMKFTGELRRLRQDRLKKLFASKASKAPENIRDALAEGIESFLFRHDLSDGKNHFTFKDGAKYSYMSESSTPMNGDVLWLVKNPRADKAIAELVGSVGYPHGFRIQNWKKFVHAFQDLQAVQTEYLEETRGFDRIRHAEREYLGNSSRPVLTKKRFLEELEAGHDIAHIKTRYRGWENKPLPQWQAHYTMGTYRTDMAEESPDDRDVTKISREQAIDMLKSGIPADEIYDTYPTSFTKGQLRAYRAHITMGSYQTEGSAA